MPSDHLVRKIAAVLDLSWVHAELADHYSILGQPSIDPELMLRLLILGYVFGIRSERALIREVQVNLAYRRFCGLGGEGFAIDAHLIQANANRAGSAPRGVQRICSSERYCERQSL